MAVTKSSIQCRAAFVPPGMMDCAELEALGTLITRYPWQQGGIVAEIGTYHGKTAVFMALLIKDLGFHVPVVAIDPFERSGPADHFNARGDYAAYCEAIVAGGVQDLCIPIGTFATVAHSIVGDIGVLVVDGNHTYEDCLADLTHYAPKVLKGGFIFIDDYLRDIYPGVVRATDEFFADNPRYRLTTHANYAIAEVAA